jgi:hypothetical protein
MQHAVGYIELCVRAVSQTERGESELTENARSQRTTQQSLPKGTGILWHFALASSGKDKDNHIWLDDISQLDRVQIEYSAVEMESLCQTPDFFSYILGVSCL